MEEKQHLLSFPCMALQYFHPLTETKSAIPCKENTSGKNKLVRDWNQNLHIVMIDCMIDGSDGLLFHRCEVSLRKCNSFLCPKPSTQSLVPVAHRLLDNQLNYPCLNPTLLP
jgi:hypothetical protein